MVVNRPVQYMSYNLNIVISPLNNPGAVYGNATYQLITVHMDLLATQDVTLTLLFRQN